MVVTNTELEFIQAGLMILSDFFYIFLFFYSLYCGYQSTDGSYRAANTGKWVRLELRSWIENLLVATKVIDLKSTVITRLRHLGEASVQVMALPFARQNKRHGKERFTTYLQRRSYGRQRQLLHGEDVHQQDLNHIQINKPNENKSKSFENS